MPDLLLYLLLYIHVYYQEGNRLSAQVGCMREVIRAGALGRPRGMDGEGGRRGNWDGEHM